MVKSRGDQTHNHVSIVGLGIISSLVLITWANWSDNLGIAVKMAESIQYYPTFIVITLLIPAFAFLNALIEEVVYRGVLQQALSDVFMNNHIVVLLQASAFASFHFAVGFPNGMSGYALTLLYGGALGYMRIWTNGLVTPLLCHLIADLTIFYYVTNLVI
ncbi:MAG: CPBP family intramembrane metalloprotease [Gammaproteobacteria bacterium]|nr:CPBP family intramembrane metalloprotease [Gammaproteobacteria bacterium]